MSSQTNKNQEMPAIMPCRMMRGHTDRVHGVLHLPEGRHIITCSWDGPLRLWDLEGNAQIVEDWRDDRAKNARVYSMALSPNGTMLASGSQDGKVRLWDIDTRKVIEKWTGHTNHVLSVCWSGDGKRVLSGSSDGTARILDAKSGKTVLNIKTGHERVYAVIYSPNQTKIATGGDKEDAVKIWDAKTGKLLTTLKHDNIVLSLAWDIKQKEALGPVRQPLVSFVWVRFVLKRTDVEVKRMLPRVSHTVTHVDNQ